MQKDSIQEILKLRNKLPKYPIVIFPNNKFKTKAFKNLGNDTL